MQGAILEFINKHKLFTFQDKLLLAISGGSDSVALLHLLHNLGYKILVCHCNFQLRGKEADQDERFVLDLCKQLNINVLSRKFDTKKFAKEHKISTQMAARKLRYDWFEEIQKQYSLDYIVTAHHLNDNVETLLLNLVNGTGPKGLKGIPLKIEGKVVRPFLEIRKETINQYLIKNHLTWREDASNQSNDYSRNKIRNQVIPLLEELNPGLLHTMQNNLKRFENLNQIFQERLSYFIENEVFERANDIVIRLTNQDKIIGFELLLEEFLKPYFFNIHQINSLLNAKQNGKRLINEKFEIIKTENELVISKIGVQLKPIEVPFEGQFENDFGKFYFKIIKDFPEPEQLKNKNHAYLNLNLVTWPITIRNVKVGDHFYPFGMQGKKLISDFLTDLKINRKDKQRQIVLENNQEIIWLVQQRISEKYRVNPNSKAILEIVFEEKKLNF